MRHKLVPLSETLDQTSGDVSPESGIEFDEGGCGKPRGDDFTLSDCGCGTRLPRFQHCQLAQMLARGPNGDLFTSHSDRDRAFF